MTDEAESKESTASLSALVRSRRVLGRIRRRFQIDPYDVFARKVEAGHLEFSAPDGYRFSWARPEEIAACDPYHTELTEEERATGVERLKLGHRAVIAFHGETTIFTMWVNPRNVNVPGGIKRRLHSDQVFIYKAYTSPDHRGKKIYQAGMRFVLHDLARRDMRQLVGYAHTKKAISRSGLAALEFATLGRFTVVDIPGFRHTFVSRKLAACFPEVVPRTRVVVATNAT